jgi:hypothetical protein
MKNWLLGIVWMCFRRNIHRSLPWGHFILGREVFSHAVQEVRPGFLVAIQDGTDSDKGILVGTQLWSRAEQPKAINSNSSVHIPETVGYRGRTSQLRPGIELVLDLRSGQ